MATYKIDDRGFADLRISQQDVTPHWKVPPDPGYATLEVLGCPRHRTGNGGWLSLWVLEGSLRANGASKRATITLRGDELLRLRDAIDVALSETKGEV